MCINCPIRTSAMILSGACWLSTCSWWPYNDVAKLVIETPPLMSYRRSKHSVWNGLLECISMKIADNLPAVVLKELQQNTSRYFGASFPVPPNSSRAQAILRSMCLLCRWNKWCISAIRLRTVGKQPDSCRIWWSIDWRKHRFMRQVALKINHVAMVTACSLFTGGWIDPRGCTMVAMNNPLPVDVLKARPKRDPDVLVGVRQKTKLLTELIRDFQPVWS